MIGIGRTCPELEAFAGNGFDALDGLGDLLGHHLALGFVVGADTSGDLAGGFLHAAQTPLLKVRFCARPAGGDERDEQATQDEKNFHGPKPHPWPDRTNVRTYPLCEIYMDFVNAIVRNRGAAPSAVRA